MSLIEVTVALGIIALVASIVGPAMSSFTRAELRATSGKLSGTIRATYDSAAMSGRTQRLVFEIGKSVVMVEEAVDERLQPTGLMGFAAMLSGASAGAEAGDSASAAPLEVKPPNEVLSVLGAPVVSGDSEDGGEIDGTASELKRFKSAGHGLNLGESVRVLDVWLEGMTSPQTEGKVFLTFYQHGYGDNALIHLTDEDGNIFTVKVHGLTGRAEVLDEYVEAKK